MAWGYKLTWRGERERGVVHGIVHPEIERKFKSAASIYTSKIKFSKYNLINNKASNHWSKRDYGWVQLQEAKEAIIIFMLLYIQHIQSLFFTWQLWYQRRWKFVCKKKRSKWWRWKSRTWDWPQSLCLHCEVLRESCFGSRVPNFFSLIKINPSAPVSVCASASIILLSFLLFSLYYYDPITPLASYFKILFN